MEGVPCKRLLSSEQFWISFLIDNIYNKEKQKHKQYDGFLMLLLIVVKSTKIHIIRYRYNDLNVLHKRYYKILIIKKKIEMLTILNKSTKKKQ